MQVRAAIVTQRMSRASDTARTISFTSTVAWSSAKISNTTFDVHVLVVDAAREAVYSAAFIKARD